MSGNNKGIKVQKASGELVPFQEERLKDSLEKSGARQDTIEYILREVRDDLYEGMPTQKIYRKAYKLLKARYKPLAAKYKLKSAIMEMGPSGYPFEKYVGALLKSQGYEIKVGVIVQGHCVQHEVDVVAEKDHKHFMIECKYHNRSGYKTDVKIPLYIFSRFKDIEQRWKELPGHAEKFHQGWLVTNTQFTEDAIQYGTCAGLNLIGWDYPQNGNLQQRIETSGLYPVTCLGTITRKEKQLLMEQGVVLCRDLVGQPDKLASVGIGPRRFKRILEECEALSHPQI